MSAREQGTYTPIPAGEAIELPPDDGMRQWNLAVKLQDASRAAGCARAGDGMGAAVSAQRTIARCIRACTDVEDGRGRWRHRDACAVSLAATGSAATAEACAAAAERLGAWLRGAHARASAAVRAAA